MFDAEAYLRSLEPLGWRFGLERMRKLVSALGMPQHRFASIHVVGTNGKSSVTEATTALLEAHGVRAGAYLSPHLYRFSERVRLGRCEIAPADFAAAVERVAQAVEVVDRTLEEGDAITQFEAATAAAFVALAAARVEVAVVEAGLGGRLDATNVLPSRVTALTSVGLEHTQWLGESELEIAGEKLAVLRDHSTLVLGRVRGEVEGLARRIAAERHARVVSVRSLSDAVELVNPAPYARANFAVALACADAVVVQQRRDHPHGRGLPVRPDDVNRREALVRRVEGGHQPAHAVQAEAHAEELQRQQPALRVTRAARAGGTDVQAGARHSGSSQRASIRGSTSAGSNRVRACRSAIGSAA